MEFKKSCTHFSFNLPLKCLQPAVVFFLLLLLSPNTPQSQMSAESWRGLIVYRFLWRGLKSIPSGRQRGPSMNKQLNHHKADIWACQGSWGELRCTVGEGVRKESRKIPQTQTQHACCSGCEATVECCDNVIMSTCKGQQTTMSHWELICLLRHLELHLHRMDQRQTPTAPAGVPVAETCLFASSA